MAEMASASDLTAMLMEIETLKTEAWRRMRTNRLARYKPYPKQEVFHAASLTHRERLLMAANQCLAPDSVIQTGLGERRIAEMIGAGGFDVRSWADGGRCTAQALPVFLKGIEPAFRLHLDNGEAIDCSRRHRVLTRDGWQSVETVVDLPDDDVTVDGGRHVPLVGSQRIVSVESLGMSPILDFTVPGTHTYEAAGVVHHNSGKSYCGAAEMAIHLTGLYPDWWVGRKFCAPVRAWAASMTGDVTRDTCQRILVGEPRDESKWGEGMLPKSTIIRTVRRQGVADALDGVVVQHATGGQSMLGFKSYEQGRQKFQGETLDVVWLDEECDEEIYMEALTRTNATNGMIYLTFTPLLGMSSVVRMFLHDEKLETAR